MTREPIVSPFHDTSRTRVSEDASKWLPGCCISGIGKLLLRSARRYSANALPALSYKAAATTSCWARNALSMSPAVFRSPNVRDAAALAPRVSARVVSCVTMLDRKFARS